MTKTAGQFSFVQFWSVNPPPANPIRLGMSGVRKDVDVPSIAARGEFAVHEFINSTLPPEQLKLIAVYLLNSEELPRRVRGLTPENQVRFLDRVNQVRRGQWFNAFPHRSHKGSSHCRHRNHGARGRLGSSLQRHWTPTEFSCTHRRARETRKYSYSLHGANGHMAGEAWPLTSLVYPRPP